MWTPEHRAAARRQGLRYASDLTDEEWGLVAPMIPPARCGGRPRDVLSTAFSPAVDRLPVAGAAQGFAAEKHGAPFFQGVGLGRHAGAYPPCALRRGARAGGPRSQPERGNHRQSKRQDGAKRGASMDPQRYDAGKKVTGRKRHILVGTLGLCSALRFTLPIFRIATVSRCAQCQHARLVSFPRENFRRWRLSGPACRRGGGRHRQMDH
jgi:putative transposase